MKQQNIECKVCNQGKMTRKKIHRMSGPVVLIGYILLIPSIIGILIGALIFIMSIVGAGSASSSFKEIMKKELAKTDIPQVIQQKVIEGDELTDQEKSTLTQEQKNTLDSIRTGDTLAKAGAGGVAAGMIILSVVIAIGSFVGGLIGWLLVMKKKVLQCLSCGAVVNAS